MRYRNIKNKEEILKNSCYIIKNPEDYKGHFKDLFKNDNPIHLEIGSGRCSFLFNMAKKYPNINFIGLEKYSHVLATGVKNREKLNNLYFINNDAENINNYFYKEISKLYLNFSDPWPKKRHAKRRLTHENFLKKYDDIFGMVAFIEQKTDNFDLFSFSLVSLSKYGYTLEEVSLDLEKLNDIDNVKTEYETKFSKMGMNICRLRAVKLKK